MESCVIPFYSAVLIKTIEMRDRVRNGVNLNRLLKEVLVAHVIDACICRTNTIYLPKLAASLSSLRRFLNAADLQSSGHVQKWTGLQLALANLFPAAVIPVFYRHKIAQARVPLWEFPLQRIKYVSRATPHCSALERNGTAVKVSLERNS